jgi:hypothetical protein
MDRSPFGTDGKEKGKLRRLAVYLSSVFFFVGQVSHDHRLKDEIMVVITGLQTTKS